MEKDRVELAELEKRIDTFIHSEEVKNYLFKSDFQNKYKKAKQEDNKLRFLNDEQDLMLKHFGATGDQGVFILLFFFKIAVSRQLKISNFI